MKFINGHQLIVKHLGPKNVIGTAEGGMGADKGSIGAVEKALNVSALLFKTASVSSSSVQRFHFGSTAQSAKKRPRSDLLTGMMCQLRSGTSQSPGEAPDAPACEGRQTSTPGSCRMLAVP